MKRFALAAKTAGLGFTAIVAVLGYALASAPGFKQVGPMASAIIIAIVYRQFFGYPENLRPGIQIASKTLLRFAIVLYGLKLNMDILFQNGLLLLVYDAGTIIFAIILTLIFAKLLKADFSLSLLTGIGTGVCGAAAIAAVSPIINAKEEDTAVGIGIIALVGTIFSVGYTLLRPLIALTDLQYGVWSGISLHEIAHVALAASPYGQDALAMALLAKLGRVFLLIPLSFILIFVVKRLNNGRENSAPVEFPWFLAGFIFTSILSSFVFGKYIAVSADFIAKSSAFTSFLLTMAMVGLGLNVSLSALRSKALRPLLAMAGSSVLLSWLTFYLV